MFGIYRFLLAILVATSHIQSPFQEFHIGALAVIGFYTLSGYLMTLVYLQKFKPKPYSKRYFYLDRLIRIFPLYLFFTLLLLIFKITFLHQTPNFSFLSIFSHLTLLPLNYYPFIPINLTTDTNLPIISPTWSLATEFHFYLLVPFLVISPYFVALGSFASSFLFALVSLKSPDPFTYAYTLPAPIFFTFLSGSLLYYYQKHKQPIASFTLVTLWVCFVLLLFILTFKSRHTSGFNIETITGFLLALPLINLLSRISPHNKLDKFFGALSYPIFLNHFLILDLFQIVIPNSSSLIFTLAISIVTAFLAHKYIETPLTKLRHTLTKKK